MGIHGGIAAEPEHLSHMYQTAEKLFGDRFSFSVISAGRKEFALGTQGVSMGGHVRVADNLCREEVPIEFVSQDQVSKFFPLCGLPNHAVS